MTVGFVLMKAAAFLMIIVVAYGLKRLGFFHRDDFALVSRIVMNITLPCAVITNFSKLGGIDRSLLFLVPMGLGCNLLTIGVGYLVSRRKDGQEKAFHMINLSGYNIGSFAMPYIQNFLGPAGVVATCLFDAGNSVMCTGATYSVASMAVGGGEKLTAGAFLKRTFRSVTMCTYLVMLTLTTLELMLPQGVLIFAETVGAANGFMAMLMIGIGFEISLERSQLSKIGKLVGIRLVVAICLAMLFYLVLPFPLEVRQVLAIISFAPVSSVCTAFTNRVGGDVALASAINSVSIVLGVITMTALLLIMGIGV